MKDIDILFESLLPLADNSLIDITATTNEKFRDVGKKRSN